LFFFCTKKDAIQQWTAPKHEEGGIALCLRVGGGWIPITSEARVSVFPKITPTPQCLVAFPMRESCPCGFLLSWYSQGLTTRPPAYLFGVCLNIPCEFAVAYSLPVGYPLLLREGIVEFQNPFSRATHCLKLIARTAWSLATFGGRVPPAVWVLAN